MINNPKSMTRRGFIGSAAGLAATGTFAPYWFTTSRAYGEPNTSGNDRPNVGAIGTGDRWKYGLRPQLHRFGDVVAVCDVDAQNAAEARSLCGEATGHFPDINEDYRILLDRDDIDVVTIATPDHWHTRIAIQALRAGKDVYCEKPVTLTIDEGKRLCRVVKETNRVFQVGTQQRTEFDRRFLKALALVEEGRLGEIKRIRLAIGGAPSSSSIPKADPPKYLNWERWLGQAPLVDYRVVSNYEGRGYPPSRCHYEFRWWYEYSGGKLTDWGAHHVDIAQWAIRMTHSGPKTVELLSATHPVPLAGGFPMEDDCYNTATAFNIRCVFPGDVEVFIRDSVDDEDGQRFENGILIEGSQGRIFVNRSSLRGRPVDDLQENPLPEDAIRRVYGTEPTSHMGNFFDCVKTREQPISDMFTHHRILTTCHLANIAMRLGRNLQWDAQAEQIIGDGEANAWLTREQRAGYEIPS